jgi:metal-dependent hydrolase (beta-lactamase superfamily II)
MMAAQQLSEVGFKVKTVVGGIHLYRGKYLKTNQ